MSLKLLSVDDSKTIRMIVTRALKNYDCIVSQAANGEEGLALATSERPDVIVLDITMPVMDGVTMLARLREDVNLQSIPVVMLTAESSQENIALIASLGVRDYIVKPFKDEQLTEKISRIIPLTVKAAA